MTLQNFMNEAISPWMQEEGPDSDIVLSSRIRLARNFANATYPLLADADNLEEIRDFFKTNYENQSFQDYQDFAFIAINDLSSIEKRVLVEKHLISPHLVKNAETSAVL